MVIHDIGMDLYYFARGFHGCCPYHRMWKTNFWIPWWPLQLKSHWKRWNVHIMYNHNILFRLHHWCYSWIPLEKWCKSMPISCMTTIYCSDYIINVTVEFPSKKVQIHTHIMYDHNILFRLHNQCYGWILLEKWCWKHMNTSIFG